MSCMAITPRGSPLIWHVSDTDFFGPGMDRWVAGV